MVHQCVIKSVVMWLHILVGPRWCVNVKLFGSRLTQSTYEKCKIYTLFFKTITCAFVGE